MPEEYFLGYRINESAKLYPRDSDEQAKIDHAHVLWFDLFKEKTLTECITFDVY